MIMAIFFMIIIATLLTYMLAETAGSSERTTKIYLNEQGQLLAKSAVEYALLRVSGFNRAGADGVVGTADDVCLPGFTMQYPSAVNPLFDITVRINYHGLGNACTGNGTVPALATAESVGTMLIDVYVQNNPAVNLDEPIRYHRRTLQKL